MLIYIIKTSDQFPNFMLQQVSDFWMALHMLETIREGLTVRHRGDGPEEYSQEVVNRYENI